MLLSDQKNHTSNGSVGNLSNHDKPSSGSGSGALSRLKIPRGTRSTPFSTVSFPVERPDPIGDRDTARKVGENMIVFMRDFFVSLLKTVPLFLVELERVYGVGSAPALSGVHDWWEEGEDCWTHHSILRTTMIRFSFSSEDFLGSLNDDVRPFVRYVIRTTAFKVNSRRRYNADDLKYHSLCFYMTCD